MHANGGMKDPARPGQEGAGLELMELAADKSHVEERAGVLDQQVPDQAQLEAAMPMQIEAAGGAAEQAAAAPTAPKQVLSAAQVRGAMEGRTCCPVSCRKHI